MTAPRRRRVGALLALTLAWLALALLQNGARAGPAEAAKAQAKRRKAMMAAGGDGGIVTFGNANYSTIVDRRRDFDIVLVFTARSPRYGCSVCNAVETTLADVAASYKATRSGKAPELFFAAVDVDSGRELFNRYDMQHAPHVYALPRRDVKGGDALAEAGELLSSAEYEGLTAVHIANAIDEELGVRIRITNDASLAWAAMALLVLLAAAAGHYAEGDVSRFLALARSRHIWLFVCLATYGFGVSGSVYCIIRGTPLYRRYGQYGPTLFSEGGRDQYVLEGVSVSLLCIAIGISIMVMNFAARNRTVDDKVNPIVGTALNVLRVFATTIALAAAAVLLCKLFELYVFKTRWYDGIETMPEVLRPYLRAPPKVKKSSGLIPRLAKFTYFSFVNAKTAGGVVKKFDTLVLAYVKRKLLG